MLLVAATGALAVAAPAAHADDPFTGLSMGVTESWSRGTFHDTGADFGLKKINLVGLQSAFAVNYARRFGPVVLGGSADAFIGSHGSLRADTCPAPACGPPSEYQRNTDTVRFGGAAQLTAGIPINTRVGGFEPYVAGGIGFMRLSQRLQPDGDDSNYHERFNAVGPTWGGGVKWALTPRLIIGAQAQWTEASAYSYNAIYKISHAETGWKSDVHMLTYGLSLDYHIPDARPSF
jgi:opacity protein-like surface antigen